MVRSSRSAASSPSTLFSAPLRVETSSAPVEASPPAAPDETRWASATEFKISLTVVDGKSTMCRRFQIGAPSEHGGAPAGLAEYIYPAWVPPLDDTATVSAANKAWADGIAKSRSAAQWLATVLGAALAALLGTAPIAALAGGTLSVGSCVSGLVGVVAGSALLYLILRVLTPSIVGIDDLFPRYKTGKPRTTDLTKLRDKINASAGAQLPVGLRSVGEVVGRALLEAQTLELLAQMIATSPSADQHLFVEAKETRAAWYSLLEQVLQQILNVAGAQRVQTRTRLARIAGVPLGVVALLGITLAFVGPWQAPTGSSGQYELAQSADRAAATSAAQGLLGAQCGQFTAKLPGHEPPASANASERAQRWSDLTVTAGTSCATVSIRVPTGDLIIESNT